MITIREGVSHVTPFDLDLYLQLFQLWPCLFMDYICIYMTQIRPMRRRCAMYHFQVNRSNVNGTRATQIFAVGAGGILVNYWSIILVFYCKHKNVHNNTNTIQPTKYWHNANQQSHLFCHPWVLGTFGIIQSMTNISDHTGRKMTFCWHIDFIWDSTLRPVK